MNFWEFKKMDLKSITEPDVMLCIMNVKTGMQIFDREQVVIQKINGNGLDLSS